MAKKGSRKSYRKWFIAGFLIFLIVIVPTLLFLRRDYSENKPTQILSIAKSWQTAADWSDPVNSSEQTPAGYLSGEKVSANIEVNQANIPHPDESRLKSMGFEVDNSLSADAPGSSMWGYKNSEGQTLIFSYQIKPTSSNPNEPVQFNCPCSATISVFLSNANGGNSSPNSSLANPASINCKKVGGTTLIMNGPNGQYGLCDFGDNMQCEEWALYRGECPVGGVKTTGFDNVEQKYCAWVGGQTFAVADATCTLPNGKVCTDEALYNGTCSPNN